MPTLDDLMSKFASPATTDSAPDDRVVSDAKPAVADGTIKTASGGESTMDSLQDIFLEIEGRDTMSKEAQAAAAVPSEATDDGDVDFAKLAEQVADREAAEIIADVDAESETSDIVKIAAEYDSAGRIMARGFFDEFNKLAGTMDTDVVPNQGTESPSAAATPALGDRGLPTVPTNYAGSPNNDQPIITAGPEPKKVYADVLKTPKTISAGDGTSDDPEGKAISMGGGAPVGFATVRDLAGGKPA